MIICGIHVEHIRLLILLSIIFFRRRIIKDKGNLRLHKENVTKCM